MDQRQPPQNQQERREPQQTSDRVTVIVILVIFAALGYAVALLAEFADYNMFTNAHGWIALPILFMVIAAVLLLWARIDENRREVLERLNRIEMLNREHRDHHPGPTEEPQPDPDPAVTLR